MSYKIKHLVGGTFEIELENGDIKEVGKNIIGMIRYTYFEDFKLPPINWEITRKQLIEDYQTKVMRDILDGKIKCGKHEFEETNWIEKI
jgi:hypothetical protein